MPYNPAVDSVGERVLQHIEAALRGIAAPDYASNVVDVRRWGPQAIESVAFPCAVVLPLEETLDDSRLAIIRSKLDVGISLGVEGSDWAAKLPKLLADARVAILADHTRGGIAETTRVLAQSISDSTPSEPRAAAHMYVQVIFRTLRADPTTPK